jgi:hypothetical protein
MRKNDTKGGGKKEKDDRFYMPKINDDGGFYAVIRFIPPPDMDITGSPYVTYFTHGFQHNGKWYIENCPTTFGWGDENMCPVCEWNKEDWQAGNEAEVRARKSIRKEHNITNILIVKDPQTPENEGKVFLYRTGATLAKTIKEKMDPKKGSIETPVPVFDPYDGANFKLKIWGKKVDKKIQSQYDKCSFVDAQTAIGDEEYIDKILSQTFPLAPFRAKEKFKTSDQLNERFLKVMGTETKNKNTEEKKLNNLESAIDNTPKKEEPTKSPVRETVVEEEKSSVTLIDDDGEDDGFFAKLRG